MMHIGRTKGTPNKATAEFRNTVRLYLTSEFQYLHAHLSELTLQERANLFRALLRYGISPLAPESEVETGDPLTIVISDAI